MLRGHLTRTRLGFLLAIAAALIPQAALAHALLIQSDPAAGAVVDSVPGRLTLIFSEPVTPAGAGIKVYSPSGREVTRIVVERTMLSSTSRTRLPASTSGRGVYFRRALAARSAVPSMNVRPT